MLAMHGVEALLDEHDAVERILHGVLVDVVMDAALRLADERFEFLELIFFAFKAFIEVGDNLAVACERFL